MELQAARQIIDTLAQGIHPLTGEVMPEDSPYNAPPVIRALFAVSQALDGGSPPRAARPAPVNSGKLWTAEEDARIVAAHQDGTEWRQLARDLGRTPFAIETRLAKLGLVNPRPGMRVMAGVSS